MASSLTTFRVKNWSTYNQILQDRWDLNLWFSPEVIHKWHKTGPAQAHYTNQAIQVCLTIRALFNLSLRATQGVLNSLIKRLELPIKCPHYSQLSRRAKGLDKIKIPRKRGSSAFCLAIDSTGLKVYGQGEWHVRQHQSSKRRTWRKMHIAMDPVTQQIISCMVTPATVHDSTVVPQLLKPIKDPLKKVYADGAYDNRKVHKLLYKRGIKPLIPPSTKIKQSYSKRWKGNLGKKYVIDPYPELYWRNQAIEHRDQFCDPKEGRKDWKKSSGYHLRSLVETTMMRFKRTFTDKLRSRTLANQKTEVYIKTLILNKFIEIGFPYTVPVIYPAAQ
jgi:hypothetical protein